MAHKYKTWNDTIKDIQKVALPTNPCKSLPKRPTNVTKLLEASSYCKYAHEGYIEHVIGFPFTSDNPCPGSNYLNVAAPSCEPRDKKNLKHWRCTVSVVNENSPFGRRPSFCDRGRPAVLLIRYKTVDLEKCVKLKGWGQLELPPPEVKASGKKNIVVTATKKLLPKSASNTRINWTKLYN